MDKAKAAEAWQTARKAKVMQGLDILAKQEAKVEAAKEAWGKAVEAEEKAEASLVEEAKIAEEAAWKKTEDTWKAWQEAEDDLQEVKEALQKMLNRKGEKHD